MRNSQSNRIGSCRWHYYSGQSRKVGENIDGHFYCANCGHQLNHYFSTNDNMSNNASNNKKGYINNNNNNNNNNSNIQPFI